MFLYPARAFSVTVPRLFRHVLTLNRCRWQGRPDLRVGLRPVGLDHLRGLPLWRSARLVKANLVWVTMGLGGNGCVFVPVVSWKLLLIYMNYRTLFIFGCVNMTLCCAKETNKTSLSWKVHWNAWTIFGWRAGNLTQNRQVRSLPRTKTAWIEKKSPLWLRLWHSIICVPPFWNMMFDQKKWMKYRHGRCHYQIWQKWFLNVPNIFPKHIRQRQTSNNRGLASAAHALLRPARWDAKMWVTHVSCYDHNNDDVASCS